MQQSQDISALMNEFQSPETSSTPLYMHAQRSKPFDMIPIHPSANTRKTPVEDRRHLFAQPKSKFIDTFSGFRENSRIVSSSHDLDTNQGLSKHATNLRRGSDALNDEYSSSPLNRLGAPLQRSPLPDPNLQSKRPRLSLVPTNSRIFSHEASSPLFSPTHETASYAAHAIDDDYQKPPHHDDVEEWLANEEAALTPDREQYARGNYDRWQQNNECYGVQDDVMDDWEGLGVIGDGYELSQGQRASSQNEVSPQKITRFVPKSARNNDPVPPQNAVVARIPLRPVSELRILHVTMLQRTNIGTSLSLAFEYLALRSDMNLVVSAPTGSGKTVIMELAMIRSLMHNEHGAKMIYMAPTKALCSERSRDWEHKFRHLGLSCKELTGDTNFANINGVKQCDIMTDHQQLMSLIRLFMIDEVHMLKEKRGATLEAVVSRMKTMGTRLRYMALSATIPNIKDVARWIGDAKDLVFGEEYRPVRLLRQVYAYASNNSQNMFMYEKLLDWKLLDIIEKHSNQKPTLVFCSTRKSAQGACETLIKDIQGRESNSKSVASAPWPLPSKQRLKQIRLVDKKLQEMTSYGVAFHHAGLDFQDRRTVESLFMNGTLQVVNLPAHLVIIKSTKGYTNGTFQEYSDLEILQMIGRAGRPGFDDSGCAVIMTTPQMRQRYEELVSGTEALESSLHQHLVEHLNAEICLGTISDVQRAIEWLKSTFLYVRIKENPLYYKLDQDNPHAHSADKKLEGICVKDLALLDKHGMVVMKKADENKSSLEPTECGKAMARYYLNFQTMINISEMHPRASLRDVLEVLTKADEYSELRFQQGEKQVLNTLNKNPNIRFPLKGRATSVTDKVFLLIQCTLGSIPLNDPKMGGSMTLEAYTIMSQATRIAKCIIDCVVQKQDSISLRHSFDLFRSLRAKIWENSPLVLRQLEGIGPSSAKLLAAASITSFQKLENTDPGRIELVLQAVAKLPKFSMEITQNKVRSIPTQIELCVTLGLRNTKNVTTGKGGMGAWAIFWAETSDHVFLDFRRLPIVKLNDKKTMAFRFKAQLTSPTQRVNCFVQNEDYIGLDVHKEIIPEVDPKGFISICRPAAPKIEKKLLAKVTAGGSENITKIGDVRAPPSPNYDEMFGDMPMDLEEDDLPILPPPMDSDLMVCDNETPSRSPAQWAPSQANNKENNPSSEASSASAVLLPTGREMCAHECCKIGRRHPSKHKRRTLNDNASQNIIVPDKPELTSPTVELAHGGRFPKHATHDGRTPEPSIWVHGDSDSDFEPPLFPVPPSKSNETSSKSKQCADSQLTNAAADQQTHEPVDEDEDGEESLVDPRKTRRVQMLQQEIIYLDDDGHSQLSSKPTAVKTPFPQYELSALTDTDDEDSFVFDLGSEFEDDELNFTMSAKKHSSGTGDDSETKKALIEARDDSKTSMTEAAMPSYATSAIVGEDSRAQEIGRNKDESDLNTFPPILSRNPLDRTPQSIKTPLPRSLPSSNIVDQGDRERDIAPQKQLLPSPPATDTKKLGLDTDDLWDAFYNIIPTSLSSSMAFGDNLEKNLNTAINQGQTSPPAVSLPQALTSPARKTTTMGSVIGDSDLLSWLDECTVLSDSAKNRTKEKSNSFERPQVNVATAFKPTVEEKAPAVNAKTEVRLGVKPSDHTLTTGTKDSELKSRPDSQYSTKCSWRANIEEWMRNVEQ
ncbi:Sec63 Brl domain-containing protein [Jimgerdemannia flammicorona]|uniref:DNA 3'-5' helicase n=1 Tax=Jimgerdemannia flammicorona TaxID=994334 RepID=A0A433QGE2_9FUNG|nr:Sec63 Brl domain-containing protein [Jimgerdemannia flammicorona]